MPEWQPIETAPKDCTFIGADWIPQQGGMDFVYFQSWWASDHFAGHPKYWVSESLLPLAPKPPG